MEYRYQFNYGKHNCLSEKVFQPDDGVSTDVYNYTLKTPLIMQFLAMFTEKDFNDRCLPWIMRKLLSDFTATAVCKSHWRDIKKVSEHVSKRCANSKDCQDELRGHVERFDLKGEILLWSNHYDWNQINSKFLIDVIPLCKLFCQSDFFVHAIQCYLLSAKDGIIDGSKYFDFFRRTQSVLNSECLYHEYRKLKLLWSFAHNYLFVDPSDRINLLYKLELFFDFYLDFKRERLAVNLLLDKIDFLAKRIASTQPCLLGSVRSPTAQPRNAHRLFWEWRDRNSLRAARYLQQCYNQHIDEIGLTTDQRTALDELNVLLPYNRALVSIAGHVHISISYLADAKESLTPGDIFEELDLLETNIAEDYYQFDNYFEACCLSLYSIIKYQAPVTICSGCGRIYIPKQNRDGDYNYCWYTSPKNKPGKQLTCSEYHSHFSSAFTGNAQFNELDKQVKVIRKGLSKIKEQTGAYISDNRRLDEFLRVSLTSIRKHAKELSKNNQDISRDMLLVSILDAIYRHLRVKNNAEQGVRATASISGCFFHDNIVADYDTLCEGIDNLRSDFKAIF